MIRHVVAVICFCSVAFSAKPQSRYSLFYEQQAGQYFAAENFNAGFHVLDYADSVFIPKNILPEENTAAGIINPLYRFGKLFLGNYLLTDLAMTMNHERFGHGYRILESDGGIAGITYNPPPPFSSLFSFIEQTYPANFTVQQELMFRLGGSETNLVFSDVMRKNILLDERFSHNFSLAYLYASNDMPGYTAFVTALASDPIQYRQTINALYGGNTLTRSKMRVYSFLALLTDPLNFHAIKAVFYEYLIKGKHSSRVGMIKLSESLNYLPRFRFEYTPYGPELVYQNYFKVDDKLIQVVFGHSDRALPYAWRFTANAWNLAMGKDLSIHLSAQVWEQPSIEFFVNEEKNIAEGVGGQLVATVNYDISRKEHLYGLTLQAGYKSTGYALGERLNEGLILRGGLSFKLVDGNRP